MHGVLGDDHHHNLNLISSHLVVSGDHYSTAEVIRCTPAGREHYCPRQCHDAWQEHLPTSTLCTFYMQRCSLSATYSTAGCGLRLRLIVGQLQVSPEVPWTICLRLGDTGWVGRKRLIRGHYIPDTRDTCAHCAPFTRDTRGPRTRKIGH